MYFGELSFILTLRTRSRHVNIKAFDHNVKFIWKGMLHLILFYSSDDLGICSPKLL